MGKTFRHPRASFSFSPMKKMLTVTFPSALTISQFVRVRFPDSSSVAGGERDFYFGSLAAVFDMFSEEELGVSLRALYCIGLVADGLAFTSPVGVEFKKLTMYRKKQKKCHLSIFVNMDGYIVG